MSMIEIIVTIAGLGLIVWTAWFFWFSKKKAVDADIKENIQEVLITVKGGYTPDVIALKSGKPARLKFLRKETASCSEMVIIPDFDKSASLPPGEIVTIEIVPDKPGEYEFSCQMGMLKGRLIVRE